MKRWVNELMNTFFLTMSNAAQIKFTPKYTPSSLPKEQSIGNSHMILKLYGLRILLSPHTTPQKQSSFRLQITSLLSSTLCSKFMKGLGRYRKLKSKQ